MSIDDDSSLNGPIDNGEYDLTVPESDDALSLSQDRVRGHWQSEDKRLLQILTVMESVEDWTLDGNEEVEAGLIGLVGRMNEVHTSSVIGTLSKDLLFIMAYIKSGRAIRLISWLDKKFDGMGLKIVQAAARYARDDEMLFAEANLMIERLETLRKVKHLHRVFSPSRMNFVLRALDRVNG